MKKKGPRAIPDFSTKKKAPQPGGAVPAPGDPKAQPAPHQSTAVNKPQGPPLKSGRRGA
ncbi:MAG TPA: hypothetical protein VJ717_08600 [Gemmatimonadaceae bacterium]|nr:hypothetical protein [Gemmatimonadaceae bacterium]